MAENIDISKVTELFDPGCLVGYLNNKGYFDEVIASFKDLAPKNFAIIPHYSDDLFLRRRYASYANNFVSVDCNPAEMVAKIINTDLVISTSLHGIIFAESLGIPAVWLRTEFSSETIFKYYDYYFGTGRTSVVMVDSVEAGLTCKPMQLPTFDYQRILSTFPSVKLSSMRKPAITKKQSYKFTKSYKFTEFVFFPSEHFLQGQAGVWLTSKTSKFTIDLSKISSYYGKVSSLDIVLTLKPYNPDCYTKPLSVSIVSDDIAVTHQWAKGESDVINLHLLHFIGKLKDKSSLTFAIECNNCSSPFENTGRGTLKL